MARASYPPAPAGTARSDWQAINPTLVSGLADLRRYLPSTQVNLQGLSQTETQQLLDVMIDDAVFSTKRKKGQLEHAHSLPVGLETLAEPRRALTTLGHFLFEQTGGHPLILMETLKLLRDRQWLVPRQAADGTWRFTLIVEMAMALTEEQARHELVPPSVRAMVLTSLARLTSGARELVRASAVLGDQATWKLLRQMTEPEEQVGFEALEEAIKRGLLREQEAGRGRASRYSFVHELMRDIVYTELGEARRQLLHQRALKLLSTEGAKAAELTYHALAADEMEAA